MRKILPLLGAFLAAGYAFGQNGNDLNIGQLHGNFQTDAQYYLLDSAIGDPSETYPDERLLASGFLNLTYTYKNFIAGVRYEHYQNNRLGFPVGFKGEGITYRYARFIKDGLDVTAGNFYEQFGSGMILRAYEERGLGLDNNLDGVRLIYSPIKGINIKALIGRQRLYFDKAAGIVRGADVEYNLADAHNWEGGTNLIVGGSFVSKFQEANDPQLNLPENVAAGALRYNLISGNFNLYGEYGYKANDPNSDNDQIYRDGLALYQTLSYAKGSFGVLLGVKHYDNFFFRSQRVATQTEALINYLPSLTKLHTYALPALYSFNTQANGEQGFQAEVFYRFKRNSFLGGKYGTLLTVNFSNSYSLGKNFTPRFDSIRGEPTLAGTDGYTNDFFDRGDIQYFQDFDVEIKSKVNKNLKATFTYYNLRYNYDVMFKGSSDYVLQNSDITGEIIDVNAGVLELLYKINPRHSLRTELQGLFTKDRADRGHWALLLAEYSIAPHWFFAIQDAYNYGNQELDKRLHYINFNLGYTRGTTRIQLGYGRQQEGVFCVGGICRIVPASNGFSLGVTSNF